ncbi:MAG: hypothetical protein AB1432_01390 [Bacteroidota bacterium]|jgi:hypothetical protein
MSRVENGILILESTKDDEGKCAYCGKVDDLRPYGKNNERICFECGMKDEETTQKKIEEHLLSKVRCFNPIEN